MGGGARRVGRMDSPVAGTQTSDGTPRYRWREAGNATRPAGSQEEAKEGREAALKRTWEPSLDRPGGGDTDRTCRLVPGRYGLRSSATGAGIPAPRHERTDGMDAASLLPHSEAGASRLAFDHSTLRGDIHEKD